MATPDTMPRWIDYINVDDLVPDPRNPKGHDDDQLDDSLERFAYTEAVMVDERTGMLVAGHGRRDLVLRRRAAGKDPSEGIVVDDEGHWLIPVQRGWSSKDENEAYAYLVASNELPIAGGWINDLLAAGLQALQDTENGLTGTGFSGEYVEDLLASIVSPDDLDGLEGKYGTPHESDLWPVLRFKIPPTIRDRYLKLVDELDAAPDHEKFAALVDWAEQAGR